MTEIEPSILRILKNKDQTIGTGFLVSRTLAVTCAHVAIAAGMDGEYRIRVQFTGQKQPVLATVLEEFLDLDRDIAILRLEMVPEGIQPLRLGLAEHSRAGNTFRSFGYATAANLQGIFANGSIDGYLRQHKLVQLQSSQANHGISGAPIWDEPRGVVIGMITKGHNELGRNENTTFATPAELLFAACPEIQPDETCPYLGLESFSAETERFFFGRTALTEKLLTTLSRGCLFLAVFGPSGSGKSSVIRAGLLPALKKSQSWAQVTIRPADDPFAQLNAAGLDLSDIPATKTVLFIDQFEELFTCPENIRERFIRELAAALDNPRLILIIAMRDDFYSAFNAKAAPLAGWDYQKVDVPATLERGDLIAIIEQPAASVGLSLEEGLTNAIIKDAATNGAARSSTLPLLEFALTQLWDKRREGLLTHDAYQSIGGVTGSLARWADDAYSDLPKADQPLAESLLTELVRLGDESLGLPDTRRRRTLTDLAEPARRVITHFADRRLLVTSGETVELVHDALVRQWGRLQSWVEKNHIQLQVITAVSEATNTWSGAPHNPDLLVHRGGRLDDALKLQDRLSTQERNYLAACKTSEERRRRNTILSIAFAVLTLVSVLAGWGWTSNQNAIQLGYQVATSDAAKATAVGEANSRATAQARAEDQSKIALARQLAVQAQSIYSRKSSEQQTAVLLAIRSMQIAPSIDASKILQENLLAQPILSKYYGRIGSVAFSPKGEYVISTGCSKPVSNGTCMKDSAWVWKVANGEDVTRIQIHFPSHISSAIFSPDGRYIVAGGCDKLENDRCVQGSTHVWKTATGEDVTRITDSTWGSMPTFSPDGKYIVLRSSDDGVVRVWSVDPWREIFYKKFIGVVYSAAFSSDNKYIVIGGSDDSSSGKGLIYLLETASGNEVATLVHGSLVMSVAFSPDDKYIASGIWENTIRIWDVSALLNTSIATKQQIVEMRHVNSVYQVIFSSDGKYLISRSLDNSVSTWEVPSGKEIVSVIHDGAVFSMALSPNDRYVVSGSVDGTARLWETTTGREIARMTHNANVSSVAFSTDSKYVVSGSDDGVIYIWEAVKPQGIGRMRHDRWLSSFAFSPDSKYVVSAGCDDLTDPITCAQGGAHVWEAANGREVAHIIDTNYISAAAYSPDGWHIAIGNDQGKACVAEIASQQDAVCIDHERRIDSIVFSPDGKYVTSVSDDRMFRTWEASTGKQVVSVIHDFDYKIAFSRDRKYVVVANSNTAEVWEVTTDKKIAVMVHNGPISVLAFSQDGTRVASGSDGNIYIWETNSERKIRTITYTGLINSVVFSPNGEYIAASYGGTAHIWEVATTSNGTASVWEIASGSEIASMQFDGSVSSIAFSPNGKYIALGVCYKENALDDCNQFQTQAWELASNREIAYISHNKDVKFVDFSPDGRYIGAISDDGVASAWVWRPEDLMSNACLHVSSNLDRIKWQQYIGDALPYQAVCSNLPIEPEPTASPTATPTP